MCVAVGTGFVVEALSSCSHLPVYKTQISEHKIEVPLSLFAQGELQLVRPEGFEFDIAVRKETGGAYTALLMRCTHADNQLVSTGSGFVCNSHGSRFDAKGNVTKSPAEKALRRYSAEVVGDNLIITVSPERV